MLYLITGTPGAGKTLNTIKFIVETPTFHNRAVYYYGIRDLDPKLGWEEMTEDQLYKWFELPSGSVIVIDEAYEHFPVRHGAKEVPEHVKRLATHRHHGFDVVMICQKVRGQLDAFLHGLVGQHQHYARVFGSSVVNRFVWDTCQENPNSSTSRKNANMVPAKLDKKYFGLYHSADEHTHKANLPWGKIIFVLIALGLLATFGYLAYDRIGNKDERVSERLSGESPVKSEDGGGWSLPIKTATGSGAESLTFSESFTPEVKGLPWSAPAYAEQIKAQSWPRPAACILRKKSGRCTCYTQQATRLDVSQEFCLTHVHDGFFDWTRPDFARVAYVDRMGGGVESGEGLPTPEHTASHPRRRAILIDHNPAPRMNGSGSAPSTTSGAMGMPGASGASLDPFR